MSKSTSHECKKTILKALENLSTVKYLTVTAVNACHLYLCSIYIHFHISL